ncbi:MAG TPA: type II toxin-antitoxin system HicB family antitoxin [Bacillota bacterium]
MDETNRITYPFMVRQVENDEGKLVWEAEVPDLPGCAAGADSATELVDLLSEAIDDWIAVAKEMGQDIPEPSGDEEYSGRITVRMPPFIHRRLVQLSKLNKSSLNSFILAALSHRAGEPEPAPQFASVPYLVLPVAGQPPDALEIMLTPLSTGDSSSMPNRIGPYLRRGQSR